MLKYMCTTMYLLNNSYTFGYQMSEAFKLANCFRYVLGTHFIFGVYVPFVKHFQTSRILSLWPRPLLPVTPDDSCWQLGVWIYLSCFSFRAPFDHTQTMIKRIIALEGDIVRQVDTFCVGCICRLTYTGKLCHCLYVYPSVL